MRDDGSGGDDSPGAARTCGQSCRADRRSRSARPGRREISAAIQRQTEARGQPPRARQPVASVGSPLRSMLISSASRLLRAPASTSALNVPSSRASSSASRWARMRASRAALCSVERLGRRAPWSPASAPPARPRSSSSSSRVRSSRLGLRVGGRRLHEAQHQPEGPALEQQRPGGDEEGDQHQHRAARACRREGLRGGDRDRSAHPGPDDDGAFTPAERRSR